MKEQLRLWGKQHLQGDPVIWFIAFALSIISIVVVYSATGPLAFKLQGGNTEYYLIKHGTLVLLGLVLMWAAHRIEYKYYSKLSRYALFASVPLLLYAWLFGTQVNEASRWITIPVINQSFQPSDLAKLALIANLAAMLAKRQQNIADIRESLIPVMLWCGVICGLIALTNLSTAVLLFSTCMLLMFIGRVPVKYLAMLVLVGVLSGSVALAIGQRLNTAVSRVKAFIDPSEVPYQLQQGYIAMATGGLAGKGPGQSELRNFLPYPHSDFIYATVIEEYGLAGGILIVFLYLALLYRGMVTVANSERAFGGLLSAGLSFALVVQAFINMGVAVGLGPVTGLPLPLLSMGGTSVLFTCISLGIILAVSRGEGEDM